METSNHFKKLITWATLTLIMGAVLFNSCKTPVSGNEEKTAITDTINKLMSGIINYAGQLNVDSTFKLLSADSGSIYMSEGMHYSASNLKSAFKKVYSGIKSQQIKVIFSEVKLPSQDFAIWIGFLKNNYITATDQVFEGYLCETWIWQRKPEGWRVIHYHESILKMPSAEQKSLVETALGKLSEELASKPLKPLEMRQALTDFLKKYPSFYGTTFAFAPTEVDGKIQKAAPYFYRSGNEIKQIEISESYDYTASEWYAVPATTKAPFWSAPYYDDGGGSVVMVTYAIPLFGGDNKLKGVLTSDLELK
ncbi:MAG: cache domain-containing protein [Bacteroidetes bacterium]|nr:cache domain-containing protein [Bacteroidota bacterium]